MKNLLIAVMLMALAGVASAEFDAQAKYSQSCTFCHSTGAAGAPKTGDKAAWAPRLEKGMDVLVQNSMNGYKGMPAMGMCNDCTAEQFKALIEYMSK
jgi:cytochrome c5